MRGTYSIAIGAGTMLSIGLLNGFTMVQSNEPSFVMSNLTTSQNWAGYIDQAESGKTFTDITGSWTVPKVHGVEQSANAQWIGLGGVNSEDLLQMGTLESIQNGQTVDELFWEQLPQVAVPITTVSPGDKVTTEIKYVGSNEWQLTARVTHGTQTTTKTVPVHVDSSYAQQIEQTAEWISEDPENGQNQILPMASAGQVTFSDSTVDSQPITQTNAVTDQTVMYSGDGETVVPSSISSGGTTFSTKPSSHTRRGYQGGNGASENSMPGVTIPLGGRSRRDAQQQWQQFVQLEQQMYQSMQSQWEQLSSGSPNWSGTWTNPTSQTQSGHEKSWSGSAGGWQWSVQFFSN